MNGAPQQTAWGTRASEGRGFPGLKVETWGTQSSAFPYSPFFLVSTAAGVVGLRYLSYQASQRS